MKKFFVVFVYSVLLLQANDIERIDLLVKEVKHLQSNYSICQKKLFILEDRMKKNSNNAVEVCTQELSKEREKFLNLQKEYESKQEDKSLEIALVHNLKKKIEYGEKELLEKDLQIKKLQTQIDMFGKDLLSIQKLTQQLSQEKKRNIMLERKIKLLEKKIERKIPKKEFTCKKISDKIVQRKVQHLVLTKERNIAIQERIKFIASKAKTYRTKNEADIYDAIGGKKIDKWVKGRSFTSYVVVSDGWIKITGYFVHKKWKEAKKEMWIKKEDAFER